MRCCSRLARWSASFAFEVTVVFVAGIYNTGVLGLRWLKRGNDAAVIRHAQRRHMLLLNLLTVLMVVVAAFYG